MEGCWVELSYGGIKTETAAKASVLTGDRPRTRVFVSPQLSQLLDAELLLGPEQTVVQATALGVVGGCPALINAVCGRCCSSPLLKQPTVPGKENISLIGISDVLHLAVD